MRVRSLMVLLWALILVAGCSSGRTWVVINQDATDHVVRLESASGPASFLVRAGTASIVLSDDRSETVRAIAFRSGCLRAGSASGGSGKFTLTITADGDVSLRDSIDGGLTLIPREETRDCLGQ